jgi:glycosyltransferase involved in cell wall biosynthesis
MAGTNHTAPDGRSPMSETDIRLTVIIPTKDRPSMLIRALESVLRQNAPGCEAIIVDDGAGALETINHHFPPVPRLRCLDNRERGQAPARNYGVRQAKGQVVAFLDDDDVWGRADYAAAVLDALAGRSGAAYASGKMLVENKAGAIVEEIPFRAEADAVSIRSDNRILVSGFAFSRGLAERIGPFDEGLPYYWDWDWYLRLFAAGVEFHPLGDMDVRIHCAENSVSGAANSAPRQANLDQLARKHGLSGLRLRNHESIARDEAGPA